MIKPDETRDLGAAIQGLISDNLRKINTAFVCKIKDIQNNKCSVHILDKNNTLVENVLIGTPFAFNFSLEFMPSVDDIGLLIILKNDISNYKKSGDFVDANIGTLFALNNAVFIPLSLYKQNDNKEQAKLTFKGAELELKDKEFTLKADNYSLGDAFKDLVSLLDNLANGMTGASTNPSQYLAKKDLVLQKILKVIK